MDPLVFFLIGLSGILASMIVFDVGLPRRFREVFASRRENGNKMLLHYNIYF